MDENALVRRLRERLSPDLLQLVREGAKRVEFDEYDDVFVNVLGVLKREEERLAHARDRLVVHYEDFLELPEGRRLVVLENSSPAMLVTLARDLMAKAFCDRFTDVKQCLRFATMAFDVVKRISNTNYLTPESLADLRGEAWAQLGNARRLCSDIPGAEKAFQAARKVLRDGTGDRDIKAAYLSLLGSLRSTQGRTQEAARVFDREIALRKLLQDEEKLGEAYINRGLMECWEVGPSEAACQFVRRGIELVNDEKTFLVGLLVLAEALARDGRGVEALLVIGNASLIVELIGPGALETRLRWIKGITYRALGQMEAAERILCQVREDLQAHDLNSLATLSSVDLLAVIVSQARYSEARRLASKVYQECLAQRLDRPALAAFLVLRKAVMADSATSQMAIAVADFIARYSHNRALRFVWQEN